MVVRIVKIDFNAQRAEKFARIAVEIELNQPLPPIVELDGVL
ncbi:hypothetical protein LINPERHAP1_LOCUS15423 [Linum perenne]